MSTATEERSLEEMFASLDSKLDAIIARQAALKDQEKKTYAALKTEADRLEAYYRATQDFGSARYVADAYQAFDAASRKAYTYGWIRGLIS